MIENKTEAAYRRSDALEKRRKLMAAWATYCASAPKEKTRNNVTPLRPVDRLLIEDRDASQQPAEAASPACAYSVA